MSDKLPENQEKVLEGILSSCNTETKCVTLAFCLDDNWKTRNDIKNQYSQCVDHNSWIPRDTTFFDYCEYTFRPIGLVVKRKIDQKFDVKRIMDRNLQKKLVARRGRFPVTFFKLSNFGENVGKYVAAFLIKKSAELGKSLSEILGSTHSCGDSRAPYNRVRILEELCKNEELRIADLSESLELDNNNITGNLKSLKKIGFLDYESLNNLKDSVDYIWIKGQPNNAGNLRGYKELTYSIGAFLYIKKIPMNRNTLSEKLKYKYASAISRVLTYLERKGFVKRVGPFKGEERSRVWIKPDGKKFVENTVSKIRHAFSKDIFEFKEVWENYKNNLQLKIEHCSKAVNQYEKIAPFFKRMSKHQIKQKILDLLEQNDRMRHKEIKEMLNRETSPYIRELLEEGKIKRTQEGIAVHYSLA